MEHSGWYQWQPANNDFNPIDTEELYFFSRMDREAWDSGRRWPNFWKLYGEILPLSLKVKSIKRIFTSENFFCDSHSKKIDDRGGWGEVEDVILYRVIHIISCKFAVDDCKTQNQPKTREGRGRWVFRIYDYKRWFRISTYGPTPMALNFPYTNNSIGKVDNSIGKIGGWKNMQKSACVATMPATMSNKVRLSPNSLHICQSNEIKIYKPIYQENGSYEITTMNRKMGDMTKESRKLLW